ncbi:MAG: S8 family serine peptidase [Paraglaciecola sp.]|uniref:S8 family peptidase n=1 Tax=Paraglaciecola sp. TaxID=1920173 RepID=UPI0032973D82
MKYSLIALLMILPSTPYAQEKEPMLKTQNIGKFEKEVVVGTPQKRPKLYSGITDMSPYLDKHTAKNGYSVSSGGNYNYVPSDPYFDQQVYWQPSDEQFLAYNNILPSVQTLAPKRRPVIGIIDSGFYQHPDLDYMDGYNMASFGTANERREYFYIDEKFNTSPEERRINCSAHGTGVAGVVVALRDNAIGVAGIVDADLLATRSLNCGGGILSDSSDAVLWQIGEQVDDIRKPVSTADVINLSLGGAVDHCPTFMQDAIDAANNKNVPIVVAIGNQQIDASGFTPSNCKGVINVAAATKEGDLFQSSNFGKQIDIVAFGDGVASMTVDPEVTGWWEESSFATPIVTGVIANAVSELGKLTNAEIKFFLSATATPFAPGQCDDSNRCGAGIMDANAFHSAIRDYKKGTTVILQPALSNTEFCDKDLYATNDNELARLCETYELVLPQHQSNRSDIRFEILAFDKSENMAHANGELVATSTSARMLLSTLDMSSNDYGVRMCNSERCFGDTAIKIGDNSDELPAICKQ